MTDFPLFERLQIESYSLCNRSCWFCPRTFDRSGKYLDADGAAVHNRMPTDVVLDLLDQARAMGFSGRVGFHHYSEPLLDPRNLDLARAARARGMQPCLVTNGDVLKKNQRLREEVPDVYDHVVVGLYDYETDEELARDRAWWTEHLSVARLEFSPIGPGSRKAQSVVAPRAMVPGDARIRAPDLVYLNAPCHRPLLRLLVQHDGEVALCCEDLHGDFDLGSVYDTPLTELWGSERHRRVTHDLVEGRRHLYPLCRACPAPPTGPSPAGERIDMAPRSGPHPQCS